jgi:hypothetical protein
MFTHSFGPASTPPGVKVNPSLSSKQYQKSLLTGVSYANLGKYEFYNYMETAPSYFMFAESEESENYRVNKPKKRYVNGNLHNNRDNISFSNRVKRFNSK